ncbi:MAG: hypothetical protein ACRDTC_10665 [Pseudonocardiaceae bacterium]
MSESHPIGQEATNTGLVGCLTRLSWTPEQFAYHLNRLGRALRPAVPEIHPKTPWRWLTARPPSTQPCVPRQPWPGLICSLLSRHLAEPVTLASLGWQRSAGALYVPADDGLHHPWTPPGAIASLWEVLEAMGMDRRHFVILTGTGLTTFAHDWMLDPQRVAAAARGQRVDHAVVDDLERVADARRRLDDGFAGDKVFRVVREDLRLVTDMLDNSRYTDQIGRRLYAVAAEFARIAGNRALDNDDQATAQRFFLTGLRAAHSSGDRSLGANILAYISKQACDHDPRDAVRLAESALAGAKNLTPAMEARIQASLANSAGRAGEASTAARAQGRMFELTAAVDPAVEPPYIYWWSEAEAHSHAGSSALNLGNPRQAESHYRDALTRIAPSFPRDRLQFLGKLALARVQLRELEGACRAANEAGALLRRHDSPRKRAGLVAFRTAAQPYATTTQIKDFDAKFADLLRPSSV